MEARKIYVEIKSRLMLTVEEGVDLNDVLSELEYYSDSNDADVSDSELLSYEIIDSK